MMNVFCKTLLASAIVTATLSSAAYAGEPLQVYGKLNVTAQSNDEKGESTTTIQSNASRFGVKGDLSLNNDLEAFYTIEYEVDTGDDVKENFKARNQFVGLKGNFGAISVGRNDTMLKVSQGKVDQFNDLEADAKNLFKGENRMAQTATYYTPSFGDVKFGVTYVADGDSDQNYLDVNKVEQTRDGFSLAAIYGDEELKTSNLYAALAYDSEVKGYDVLRATVQAKFEDLVVGGMYQQEEKVDGGETKDGYLLSVAYQISEVTLKAQYQDMEDKGDSWSIGGDYKLAKPTKLLAFYTNRSIESMVDNDNYLGLGIEHKF
jgi:predicted porin